MTQPALAQINCKPSQRYSALFSDDDVADSGSTASRRCHWSPAILKAQLSYECVQLLCAHSIESISISPPARREQPFQILTSSRFLMDSSVYEYLHSFQYLVLKYLNKAGQRLVTALRVTREHGQTATPLSSILVH